MATERQQLERARELILNKQFDEARAILSSLAGNATADQWLAKLEEIDPVPSPFVSSPMPLPTFQQLTDADHSVSRPVTVNLTLNPALIRTLVAFSTGLLALVMIIGFFAVPWLDMSKISLMGFSLDTLSSGFGVDKGPLEVTALEIWTGRNDGENFTLSIEHPEGGFDKVRLLDRLLFLIPAGGVVLIWLAWTYGTVPSLRRPVLMIMAAVALVMFLFPFAWETFSDRALEDELKNSASLYGSEEFDDFDFSMLTQAMLQEAFSKMYSTEEQKWLGGLAFLAALIGLLVEAAPQWQGRRAG